MQYDLYTPDQWFSISKDPSIGIEADGTVRYLRSDLNLYPITSGCRIDFSSSPKLVYDRFGDVVAVITDESDGNQRISEYSYGKIRNPVYFIVDHQIYSWDQYFSAFKDPIAFIQLDPYGSSGSSGSSYSRVTPAPEKYEMFLRILPFIPWIAAILISLMAHSIIPVISVAVAYFTWFFARFVYNSTNKLLSQGIVGWAVVIIIFLILGGLFLCLGI